MIYYLSKFLFTRISQTFCFVDLFSSSSVRSLGINFDSKVLVGSIGSVDAHTTSSSCLKLFKTHFFSSLKKLSHNSFLSILSDNNHIITPNSGVSPTESLSADLTINIVFPIIVSPPYFSVTVGGSHLQWIVLLLFLSGCLIHGSFIICAHWRIRLILISDSRRVFFLNNVITNP